MTGITRGIGRHVPAVTALLTLVSASLVFGAATGAVPGHVLPRWDPLLHLVPHLNVAVSVAAIGTILAGVRAIRRGAVDRHRRLMLASFGLFAVFLASYLYRVSLVGPAEFAGPAAVRRFVYLPVLAVHILLAVAALPAVYYALLTAATTPLREIPRTSHPRVGRVAASLWLVSFTLGIVVYLLLHVVYG